MESIFKRLFNAGIGVASKSTRFAESIISDLIEKGKLTEEEGKKIIEDFEREGEEQRTIFEQEMSSYIERTLKDMDIPTREEYNRLSERVFILEKSQPGAIQVHNIQP